MKTRAGFVANSSSSSFIVQRFDERIGSTRKKLTTKEHDAKLKKFGFFLHVAWYPEQVPTLCCEKHEKPAKGDLQLCNWCYEVACNEDEVIEFLVKNRIPFTASIHYEHEVLVYDADDVMTTVQNYGKQFLMGSTPKEFPKKIVSKTTGRKWLAGNEKLAAKFAAMSERRDAK